jgi:DNA primase catalytic core
MEISEIKQHLTISQVLKHYNLKPDKQSRLNCPFHADKTPSFQVYYKTQTSYCFSSNCKTHGKSLDVIDFIMYKENLSKHEAILKAKQIAGITTETDKPIFTLSAVEESQPNIQAIDKITFLTNIFIYFRNAVHNSKPAQEYIKSRGLWKSDTLSVVEVGYNSGQFHHGTRKDETLIQNCINLGLLLEQGRLSRTGGASYKPFGKYCIVFALRNKENQVTGMYFRSTVNEDNQKHYYLKNRSGLYPCYPKADTEKLILTEAIIDAASLLQIPEIIQNYEVLSCYGTNGLTKEHIVAIKDWALSPSGKKSAGQKGKEIVFAFDNDEAGNKATEKYSKELKELLPTVTFSKIELPENEDINSVYLAHDYSIFMHLLEARITLFSFSNENKKIKSNENKKDTEPGSNFTLSTAVEQSINPITHSLNNPITNTLKNSITNLLNHTLDTKNPYKLRYKTETATYYVQGGISKILDSMKLTLVIEHSERGIKCRNKIDLYEDKQVEKLCKEVSERLNLRKDLLESDIYKLTDLLDEYRENEQSQQKQDDGSLSETIGYPLTAKEMQKVEQFLKKENLIYNLNELLGKSGIAGEETNRIFLLIIAISHKMPEPLHALIQGSSGSGKTRLLRQISDCMPPERVLRLTRVSDKGFYNYPEKYLKNKLVSLEDVDGLGEEATFAFRELQSNGELNSATSVKLENGQIVSGQKSVKGPIASLACTTQGEIYEDNMSRVFLIAVDESQEQTKRIIKYQNNKAAGQIDTRNEQEIKHFIQNMVREIKPYEVLNPFANQIQLPEEAHKIRRLNDLFQSFVKMTTVINQYQRKKDERGRLITEISDIETAIDIMFESIVLKVDELDGSLRQFYEQLKIHIKKIGKERYKEYQFIQKEIRQSLNISKTQLFRYLNDLSELEYVQQSGGFANRGYKYKIVYWDDYKALRERIKQYLSAQIEQIKLEEYKVKSMN